jgi:hypothetical protein
MTKHGRCSVKKMDRITIEHNDGTYGIDGIRISNQPLPVQNAFEKLLAYEQTGLTPEQVQKLADELKRQQSDAEELRRKLAIWEPW